MTKVNFFNAVEFYDKNDEPMLPSKVADYCNAKLQREGVRVWGKYIPLLYSMKSDWVYRSTTEAKDENTHTALLIDIQPIEKPKCVKHEPELHKLFKDFGLNNAPCRHCGAKLVAEWREIVD